MRMNLILVIALNHDGCFYPFGNGKLQLLYDSCVIAPGLLCDGLYKIIIDPNYMNSINVMMSKKNDRIDERSFMLWHRCMGHIS